MSLIYCVEDDTGIQELISCALKSGGYEVRGFENSRNLLNSLKTEIPSLILLDVMLPGQDGFQILSDLKRNPAAPKDTPIPLFALAMLKSTWTPRRLPSAPKPSTSPVKNTALWNCFQESRQF